MPLTGYYRLHTQPSTLIRLGKWTKSYRKPNSSWMNVLIQKFSSRSRCVYDDNDVIIFRLRDSFTSYAVCRFLNVVDGCINYTCAVRHAMRRKKKTEEKSNFNGAPLSHSQVHFMEFATGRRRQQFLIRHHFHFVMTRKLCLMLGDIFKTVVCVKTSLA